MRAKVCGARLACEGLRAEACGARLYPRATARFCARLCPRTMARFCNLVVAASYAILWWHTPVVAEGGGRVVDAEDFLSEPIAAAAVGY